MGVWKKGDDKIESFSIIDPGGNELAREIHDRMPVIPTPSITTLGSGRRCAELVTPRTLAPIGTAYMRLVSLTVENFRSITTARKIPISQVTTLVGPNNEGKSNIMRALAIGMRALIPQPMRRRQPNRPYAVLSARMRRRDVNLYRWESDYPLRLQGEDSSGTSNITMEFAFDDSDRNALMAFSADYYAALEREYGIEYVREISKYIRNMTIISWNTIVKLAIMIKIGRSQATFGLGVLDERGSQDFSDDSYIMSLVQQFLADRMEIQYIPAVRTAEAAQRIVDELVASELSQIESDPEYVNAVNNIAALQQPILDALSAGIANTMRNFLPRIKAVKLAIEPHNRSLALRTSSEILVDDGAETLLEYKGDGVQSLAALAIMRHASQSMHQKKEVIVALEEPESHLHPSAIRELRRVIQELAMRQQVVLSTHNPLFTNRTDVSSNVIVRDNNAYSARTIKDVRDALGVRLADNLSSADTVLIVEGESDRTALSSILPAWNRDIARDLESGRLLIDPLGGAGNLTHRARMYIETLCKVHAFLDGDKSGRDAFERARTEGVLQEGDVNFSVCGGRREAELEDLYEEDVYEGIFQRETGLQLHRQRRDRDKKWSIRVRSLLESAGKPTDEPYLLAIKAKVAQAASVMGKTAIHRSKVTPIDSLTNCLLQKLASQ